MMDYGAIAQAGADTLGSWLNFINQYATNKQEVYLSNTAHQREVADLKAAGLNPALTMTGGHGAAVPNLEAPQFGRVDIQGIINKAQEKRVAQATERNIDESITTQKTQQNLNNATAANHYATVDLQHALRDKAYNESTAASALAKNYDIDAANKVYDLIANKAKKSIYDGNFGKIAPYLEWLRQFIPWTNPNIEIPRNSPSPYSPEVPKNKNPMGFGPRNKNK